MANPPDLIDTRLLKALEHPTRVHILSILGEGPSSPSRISRRMEHVSVRVVSHHMKVLRDLGCVELVEEVRSPNGPGVEHIYRATERQFFTDEEWEAFDPRNRTPVTATLLRLISADAANSLEAGLFDALPDNHLSRTPVHVDREGWAELVATLARTLNEVIEINARSVQRAAASGEELIPARVVMMQFPVERREADRPPSAAPAAGSSEVGGPAAGESPRSAA